MKSILEALYKRVRVETTDGELFEGEVVSCESGVISDSGLDEITIDYPSQRLLLTSAEIKEIKLID